MKHFILFVLLTIFTIQPIPVQAMTSSASQGIELPTSKKEKRLQRFIKKLEKRSGMSSGTIPVIASILMLIAITWALNVSYPIYMLIVASILGLFAIVSGVQAIRENTGGKQMADVGIVLALIGFSIMIYLLFFR